MEEKSLKPARSQAEITRTRNSNIMVVVGSSAFLVNVLVALRVFGIL